jgi:hypothetical protein
MLVTAFMMFVQSPQSHAASATSGDCGAVSCLAQKAQSQAGRTDLQSRPQQLAFKIKIEVGCPDGFHHEDGECVPWGNRHKHFGCPDDFHWDGDECVPNWKKKKNKGGGGCVVGFHWNGDRCVPDKKSKKQQGGGGCVVGFHRVGDECVPDGGGGCVVGFHWNGQKCVPDKRKKNGMPPVEGQQGDEGFQCSHNDHLENGKCVPCKAGFHVEGDECVAD